MMRGKVFKNTFSANHIPQPSARDLVQLWRFARLNRSIQIYLDRKALLIYYVSPHTHTHTFGYISQIFGPLLKRSFKIPLHIALPKYLKVGHFQLGPTIVILLVIYKSKLLECQQVLMCMLAPGLPTTTTLT